MRGERVGRWLAGSNLVARGLPLSLDTALSLIPCRATQQDLVRVLRELYVSNSSHNLPLSSTTTTAAQSQNTTTMPETITIVLPSPTFPPPPADAFFPHSPCSPISPKSYSAPSSPFASPDFALALLPSLPLAPEQQQHSWNNPRESPPSSSSRQSPHPVHPQTTPGAPNTTPHSHNPWPFEHGKPSEVGAQSTAPGLSLGGTRQQLLQQRLLQRQQQQQQQLLLHFQTQLTQILRESPYHYALSPRPHCRLQDDNPKHHRHHKQLCIQQPRQQQALHHQPQQTHVRYLHSASSLPAPLLGGIPKRVTVVEVGARDGLQNEKELVPTAVKVELIRRLARAGLPVVEATSFVSPKWVPQLADARDVMVHVREQQQLQQQQWEQQQQQQQEQEQQHADDRMGVDSSQQTRYPVLTPNLRGFRDAVASGAREVAVFAAATESFSKNNLNCSIDDSLKRYAEVCSAAKESGVAVRGYVSCVVGCPMEGRVAPAAVARVAKALYDMGCFEISLGDTIGVGTPGLVVPMLEAVLAVVPREAVAVHFHDTYGQALANILVSLQMGIGIVDASVAGLGGCPYAKGATGNVATEDVLYLLHGLGVQTGVDMDAVLDAGRYICDFLGRKPNSRASAAMLAKSPKQDTAARL